jgi:D-alanyl-D-alanine carboxypeptidase
MKANEFQKKNVYIGFAIVAIIFVALVIYSVIRLNSLSTRIDTLNTDIVSLRTDLASTTTELESKIVKTHDSLSSALSAERENVGAINAELGGFKNQVGSLSGTLNTLQKLAKTDPELLRKYSKVYFLNDNYVPARLAEIPLEYQYSNNRQLLIHTDVLPHLLTMMNSASSTGIKLYASSAYRSFAEQRALKGEYSVVYGSGTANTFSADQGYSEHQLGTTVDMITTGLGGNLDGFDKTEAYRWMVTNAYKYGFINSYPKDNKYYVFEPWHWRFVGIKLATDLRNLDENFYDLDQRKIDTYLVSIFD